MIRSRRKRCDGNHPGSRGKKNNGKEEKIKGIGCNHGKGICTGLRDSLWNWTEYLVYSVFPEKLDSARFPEQEKYIPVFLKEKYRDKHKKRLPNAEPRSFIPFITLVIMRVELGNGDLLIHM